MKEIKLETPIIVYSLNEVPDEEQLLVNAALKVTGQSYAPYSKFRIGAAALLADGTNVTAEPPHSEQTARLRRAVLRS